MIKVAINGFGRIGRCALRQIMEDDTLEVVAINNTSEGMELAYLLKYDSVHSTYEKQVGYETGKLIINGKTIRMFNESNPSLLPWKELDVDVVLECTGVFNSKENSYAHIEAGAKKVVISAPSKDECKTIVYGVNEDIIESTDEIISAASCTTNCLAPVLKVLNDNYTVISGYMATIHAITNDQSTLDVTHKKGMESRRGRAAMLNIIPTSTGAASQIGKVIPSLSGKLDGVSYRVPVADGSIIDLSVLVEKETTKEEVNELFRRNASDTLKLVNIPLVSSDIIGVKAGAVVDGLLTKVIKSEGKTMIKVSAWYDNEWGYTAQMLRTTKRLFQKDSL